ncbi:MAG: peptidase T [Tissierellales bacterium]|jgi:tripeptide aminopeptidase|nr:peptidase T [Tissierellales bacterium]
MSKALEYLLKYVAVDTQSDPESTTNPTTEKQFNLANILVDDLKELGLNDARVDEKGYVYASLKGNTPGPKLGFIAHMDTAPDASGANVKPRIIKNYDGSDILLHDDLKKIMKTCDFPVLKEYVGQDLVVTDGTTLLGADDKAGISEILAMLSHIKENPSISHPDLKIAFTPDEEVGQGADYFDVNTFGADFAYTVDGGKIGELEYENFNAAGAKIKINGRNVHPGGAKNKMINSMQIAMELNQMLPPQQRPEFTENYEGFFLLTQIEGCVEESKMQYIIRDHNRELFETKKELLKSIVTLLNQKYGENTIELELKDQYYNMREKVEPHMHIIDLAKKSMIDSGVTPLIQPIRGGTDGARLSFMGLPCPNLFTGGHNFHGIYEFIPVQSMDASVSVLIKILENSVLK